MDQQRETQKDSGMSNFQHDGVTEAPNFGTPAFVEYWLSEANMPVTRMINEFNSQMASMKSLHKEEMEAKEKDVEHWKDQADKETKACNKIIETKTMEVVNAKAALAGSKMNLAKETEKLEKLREEFETNTALLNNKLKGKEIKLQEVIKERDQYKVLYESSQEKMDDAKKFAEQLHISLEEITGKSKSFVDHVNFGLNEGELEAIQGTSQAPNNHSIHALPKPLEFDQAVGKSRKTRRKQVAKPNSCEQVANLQLSRNTKAKRSKCDRGSLPPPAAPRKARRNPARKGSSTSTPAQDDPTFYHFNQAPPHGVSKCFQIYL